MKYQKHFLVFSSIFIFLISQNYAQVNLNEEIDEVINKAVELELFSGCVLVAKEGEILYSKAVGEANKDFNIKNTLNTKFNIGSIGKSFTATAIMILAQDGLLNITDPVTKYLPDFPFGEKITIHHLLTHTSGLGDYLSNPKFIKNMSDIRRVQDLLPIIYKEKLSFKVPGEDMAYSNSGIVVLGAIIEEVANQSYTDFLHNNIFTQLKMNNTCIKFPEDVVSNRAVGYIKNRNGVFFNNSRLAPVPSPAGGLLSTVGDLLLFDQALYKNDLLAEEYKKIMFTPFKNRYAYCWGVFERFNNTVIGHSGGATGISAWIRRYINDKYTIIVLSNYDSGADVVFFRIESILFGENYTLPRVPVGEFLYPLIQKDGIEKTSSNIRNILDENNYQLRNPETLNSFGYGLLNQNDINMAISIFLLNTILFQRDANVYDSLAEAYMKNGQKAEAIVNYKKSLALNPNNDNAKEMLEKLKN